MRVVVENHLNGRRRLYEGNEKQIEGGLLFDHPFLRRPLEERGALADLLDELDSTAAYQVEVESDGPGDLAKNEGEPSPGDMAGHPVVEAMLGIDRAADQSFEAARALAGGVPVAPEARRQALFDAEGDAEKAALLAYGLPETELDSLRAVRALQQLPALGKSEPGAATASSVVAGHSEGADVADAIRRAYKDSFVFELVMGGKHSGGALIARDQATDATWLLKPGSNGAGVAAGASQEHASQSQREAAWYHVAKEWGLFDWFPRAELLLIDGKQYAAIRLLPWSYQTAEHRRRTDPNVARRALKPLLDSGVLHQLAVLYFVAGDPDAHGQNCMIDENDNVRFIDHGSAFAGTAFDPAHDKASFVPYFLRAWAPPDAFNGLPVEEKLRYLPRVHPAVVARVGKWLQDLQAGPLEALCARYGIDARPELDRLARVKAVAQAQPVDEAINRLWVTT